MLKEYFELPESLSTPATLDSPLTCEMWKVCAVFGYYVSLCIVHQQVFFCDTQPSVFYELG